MLHRTTTTTTAKMSPPSPFLSSFLAETRRRINSYRRNPPPGASSVGSAAIVEAREVALPEAALVSNRPLGRVLRWGGEREGVEGYEGFDVVGRR